MTNLIYLRVERDLSQVQLSVASGLSIGALQRAEKSYEQLTLGRLKQLANGLSVELGELLEEELK